MELTGSITLGIIITLIPFIYYNYKEIKASKKQVYLYGLLSFMISILILKLAKLPIHYIGLMLTVLICSIINYLIIKKEINIKNIPKSSFVLALFFLSVLFQFIPIIIFNYDINNLTSKQELIMTCFSNLISLVILLFIYFKTFKEDLNKLKGNLYSILDTGFKYWLIGLVVMIISNVIISLFISGAKAVNEEGVQELIKSSTYLSIFTVGILAPIIEELTFRKAFRDLINNNLVFILVSGLVFGALHVVLSLNSLLDLFYIIPYASLGIAFAYMYYKSDNIYTSIIMHIFHNTVLTSISILGAMILL